MYSIRTKFLVPIIATIIILTTCAGTVFVYHEEKALASSFEKQQVLLDSHMMEKLYGITSDLTMVIYLAALQYDFTYIKTVVDKSSSIVDLAYIYITDRQNIVMFSNIPQDVGKKLVVFPEIHKTVWLNKPVLEISKEIFLEKEIWGTFVLALTFDSYNKQLDESRKIIEKDLKEVKQFSVAIVMLSALLGSVVIVFIVKKVTSPLLNFTSLVESVEKNVYLDIPVITGSKELTYLGTVFKDMMDRIKGYMRDLEALSHVLEQKVKYRTIELEKKAGELEKLNSDMMDSILYAKTIQTAILPKEGVLQQYFPDHFVIWMPKDIVAGDFYWVTYTPKWTVVAVVDCTGHGVPGALMSMTAHSLLREIDFGKHSDPSSILFSLNKSLLAVLKDSECYDGFDISLCCINFSQKTLLFSGARQYLFYVEKGVVKSVKGNNCSIGKKGIFTNHVIPFSNTTFYLTSDGFYDQCGGEKGYSFSTHRFKEMLSHYCYEPLDKQKSLFLKKLSDYQNTCIQMDDITVIAFTV